MPGLVEQNQLANPEQQPSELSGFVGRVSLAGVEVSAGHFYGGDNNEVTGTSDGEYDVLVGRISEDGIAIGEAVGSGSDTEAALQDSLERMRSLEKVRTRSLAQIEMTGSTSVSFTSLEHYSPKIAPSRDTYQIPEYLDSMLIDSKSGGDTYRNTVAQEGWQAGVRSVLAEYLAQDPAGQRLVDTLKIRSLSHLTPEQAVKLSAAFVQNVSKYTYANMDSLELSRADKSTASELLTEGIANKHDPDWKGNGVCRNIASNVKAVFEALKQTQADLSMLNNTYCTYSAGAGGAGYIDSRPDFSKINVSESGHAWNTFVTVDSEGSAVATIIDATWALDQDVDMAVQHLDRTEVRAAAQIMQLFEKSEAKTEAFDSITNYVQRIIRMSYASQKLPESGRTGIREYVTTEYLKAAASLPEVPEDYTLPYMIARSVHELGGKLDHEEIATLFDLYKAGLNPESIKSVIKEYDSNRKLPLPRWKRAENLLFADNELQQLAFDAVSTENLVMLAEESGVLRARLREVHPDILPPFNAAERPADAQELAYFAELNGVRGKDPVSIMKELNRRLKNLAGDEGVYNAIVAGRTDYDLAKHFGSITKALRARSQE